MFWQGLFRPALLPGGRNGRFCFRAPLNAGVRMAGFDSLSPSEPGVEMAGFAPLPRCKYRPTVSRLIPSSHAIRH
jgi:hypothetical protein